MFSRQRVIRFLLRKPGALESRIGCWTVLALTWIGAGFLAMSAVIHLQLWADGYKDISVVGPLFLVQAIACIIIAVAVVAFRWLALLVAGAVVGVATAAGLLLSVYVGLFGYAESVAVPSAVLSLAVEFAAALVLLADAGVLALAKPPHAAHRYAPAPSRTRSGQRQGGHSGHC